MRTADDGSRVRLFGLLEQDDPAASVESWVDRNAPALDLDAVRLVAPIDGQEVWGAGVTYLRSKVARQEESEQGGSFYDQVYTADRPELFFKAAGSRRISGPKEPVRVRADSQWSVPEPELALVLNSKLRLVGFTIGNDMSARDIEGRNPLYLPQAKVHDGCCGLGPWITLAPAMPAWNALGIGLTIERGGGVVFEGSTSTSQIVRTPEELISWLGRDQSFPDGAVLLTGTGIVPPDEFTLRDGDVVRISIEGIGTLVNPVVQGG
jgi:2-dehydro-3-deoxy-D-arabinonate dehydratase